MSRVRDNIDMYRRLCVECGTCREVCPSYNHGGCDPLAVMRGEYRRVFDCVGCGSCSRACEHTNPKIVMMAAYSIVLDTPVSQAFLDTGYSRYPAADAPGADLEPVWDGEEVCVMPGCVAKCVVPYVVYAASSGLRGMGAKACELPDFTCCMYPIQFGTMQDEERVGYIRRMGETAGEREIINLCGGCTEIMNRHGVECRHLIPFLHDKLDSLPRIKGRLKVSVEPGCAAVEHADEMTDIVRAMGCEPVGNEPGCCGKNSRNVAKPLMDERQEAARDADVIVVGCPMCQSKYDSVPGGKPVMHLAELLAAAFGDRRSLECHTIPVPDF